MSIKTFVLVHGAWHSAICWSRVIPLLQAQGHKVVAPDLPGHGENTIANNKLSLKLYVRYLVELIDSIDSDVYLVGHSMAGVIISQVGESLPSKISRLIYLSAFLPCNGQSVFDLMSINRVEEKESEIELAMEMSADKRSCTINPSLIKDLFYGTCPEVTCSTIIADIKSQATLPLAGKVHLTQENFGALPKTYICCLKDKVIPINQQRQMLAQQDCEKVIQLDTDHSPFYSNPEGLINSIVDNNLQQS